MEENKVELLTNKIDEGLAKLTGLKEKVKCSAAGCPASCKDDEIFRTCVDNMNKIVSFVDDMEACVEAKITCAAQDGDIKSGMFYCSFVLAIIEYPATSNIQC